MASIVAYNVLVRNRKKLKNEKKKLMKNKKLIKK